MRKLYDIVFHDSELFTNMLFLEVIKPENTLSIYDNGSLVASLNLLNYQAQQNGTTLKCGYIYAVMTHPNYRRKGFMRRLLGMAIKKAKTEGFDFLFLVEQEAYLTDIYEKFGFKKSFYTDYNIISRIPQISKSVQECTSTEAYAIYKKEKCNRIFLSYEQFDFEIRSIIIEGGRSYIDNETKAWCLTKRIDDIIIILAQIGNEEQCNSIYCQACLDFKCRTLRIETNGISYHKGMTLTINDTIPINSLQNMRAQMLMNI